MGKTYNELFAKLRTEFILERSDLCSVAELRYVPDMALALVKRKSSGAPNREKADMKENLLKDIFSVYLLGEGSIGSLPENMVGSERRYVNQEVETDSCLSRILFQV